MHNKVFILSLGKMGGSSVTLALNRMGIACARYPDLRKPILAYEQTGDLNKLLFENMPLLMTPLTQHFVGNDRVRALSDLSIMPIIDQLLQLYPDSKIVCLERDKDAWLRSVNNWFAMKENFYNPTRGKNHFFRERCFGFTAYVDPATHFNELSSAYENYQGKITALEKRGYSVLRFNLIDKKQGYNELCEFLEMPVENNRFPYANSSACLDVALACRVLLLHMAQSNDFYKRAFEFMLGCNAQEH